MKRVALWDYLVACGTGFNGFLLDSWPLNLGPIGCPETSVRNCHYTLRNSPEEHRSHLLRGGSLKSRLIDFLPKYAFHIGYVKCARSNIKLLHRRHTCRCSRSWSVAVHICTVQAPIVKTVSTSPCYFTPYKNTIYGSYFSKVPYSTSFQSP